MSFIFGILIADDVWITFDFRANFLWCYGALECLAIFDIETVLAKYLVKYLS